MELYDIREKYLFDQGNYKMTSPRYFNKKSFENIMDKLKEKIKVVQSREF